MDQVERMERVLHNGRTVDRTYLKQTFWLPLGQKTDTSDKHDSDKHDKHDPLMQIELQMKVKADIVYSCPNDEIDTVRLIVF